MSGGGACDACLARTWLLVRLAGHIDLHCDRIEPLLTLADAELIAALGGSRRQQIARELERFDARAARRQARAAGVEQLCRCRDSFPASLLELDAPPSVLHVAGDVERFLECVDQPAVAIVGARQPSPYGIEIARALARRLATAGLPVISGMALGIDTAAHIGALDADGPTVAVLACAPERAYPRRARALHGRVRGAGAVVSELPPGVGARRWMFPARNRLIAALSALTIVVEAREGSGALVTARRAAELGRPVGAVPGRVTSPLARGAHRLLRDGAILIETAEDVLDGVYGPGARKPAKPTAPPLPPPMQALLEALAEGHAVGPALARCGLDAEQGLAALASLELAGRIRRGPGGAYSVLP